MLGFIIPIPCHCVAGRYLEALCQEFDWPVKITDKIRPQIKPAYPPLRYPQTSKHSINIIPSNLHPGLPMPNRPNPSSPHIPHPLPLTATLSNQIPQTLLAPPHPPTQRQGPPMDSSGSTTLDPAGPVGMPTLTHSLEQTSTPPRRTSPLTPKIHSEPSGWFTE